MFFSQSLSRRSFLTKTAAAGIAATVPTLLTTGEAYAANHGSWKVNFENAHTGDSYSGIYRNGDQYSPEAFQKLSYVLRDFRTGEIFPMDPHVIDILSMIQNKTRQYGPITILSGYRSPKTNHDLGKRSRGVAKNSFHMYGRAIDLHIDGYSTRGLRNVALGLRAGGVGYYPRSNFVHVDTGDVRTW